MDIVYGVEVNPFISEIPEFENLLSSDRNLLECQGCVYIYEKDKEALLAKKILAEADLFEELHPLLLIDNGKPGENFFDYGFNGQNGVYLYKELLTAFTLKETHQQSLELAKLQLEEHLVYVTLVNNQEIFFVESHLDHLVTGIANAYKCEAHFLDLDKWKKNL